ncbi:hypothetical protein [Streptomyces sp. YU58]|uniref:hypothetical protein n=1 Tax=Streptomyces sp. SX92 TaxID=3158972 RepID=UPI0027B89555|nr:hypothetical protein [Streptomyces coralus]WLW53333.1 hypothetical protein QU709_18985 [Streptomyces coralus]
MEPITAGLLVALASGTAGAMGEQLWASLRDLVLRRRDEAATSGGEGEVVLPAEPPSSEERARHLAELLNRRAAQDPDFADALERWRREADDRTGNTAPAPAGDVHNVISGGTQNTVIQARDIHGSINLGG